MRAKLLIAAAAWMILMMVMQTPAGAALSGKSLLDELSFPELPGSKLLTEVNLPQGSRLDDLEKQYGSQLGLRNVKQINMVVYSIASRDDAQEIFQTYEPSIVKQDWKTMFRAVNQGTGVAILSNEKMGMLILIVDPSGKKDRTLTVLRIEGQMDASAKADPKKISEFIGDLAGGSRIPIAQPISVPPSDKLHLKSTRSDIKGKIVSQSTAEITLTGRADNPGELSRVDDRLVLELAPKASVDEVTLPGNVALLIELTEGSLTLKGTSGDKPAKLNVISTGASVNLESIPLVSGTHNIKSVNGEVKVSLSPVEGGVLGVEVTGADVTLTLPKDASATVKATTTSGKIQNQTSLTPSESSDDSITLKMGAGKAEISLKAVNGTVCIKQAN